MNNRIRIRPRVSMRMTLKQVVPISTLLLISLTAGLFFYFNLSNVYKSYAATTGDYRSAQSGNWNSNSTWQIYNGTSWIAASVTPDNTNGVIEIQNTHTVTVSASVTADQIVVDNGGSLTIAAAKTLTINNGTGTDLDVSGTLTAAGILKNNGSTAMTVAGLVVIQSGGSNTFAAGSTITINNGGRYRNQDGTITTSASIWTVNSGGVYQHDVDGNTIPLANWNTGSTCEITGVVVTQPSNLTQSFNNFTYNCPNQTSTENWQGKITTINGDFTYISSGTGINRFGQPETYTLNVGGNFNMQGGSLFACTKSTGCTISISGNYVQTGGTFGGTDISLAGENALGVPTINVSGNFSISSGTFDMTQNTGTAAGNGICTLNLYGNFTQTGGTITETATTTTTYGSGKIYFAKSGTQIFSKTAGTISNTVHFTVNSGAILNMGTSYPTGSGNFTLASGGGLNLGSANGITQSSALGNVQVTGTRSFSTSGNYTYNGLTGQNSGDGLPATVNNLTLNNSYHLTLTDSVGVSGILTLFSGHIITGANEVWVTNSATSSINSYSSANYIVGNLRRNTNSSGSYDFPIGTSSNYELISITLNSTAGFSNLAGAFVAGDPTPTNLPAGLNYNGKYFNKMVNNGYWTLTPNTNMTSGTYDIQLFAMGQTNTTSTDSSDYILLKRHDNSANWSINNPNIISQHAHGNSVETSSTGLTTFSHFGQAMRAGTVLPISLIYFNAKLNGNQVDLSWSTAAEINNDYFTIERSSDAKNFEMVLRKQGAGNNTGTLYYSGVDENPLHGYSYYRLKQTDYDGHYSYSEIKTVKYKSNEEESGFQISSVAPNPFSERFRVSFILKKSADVTIHLINSSGQIVFKDVIYTEDGMNQYDFEDRNGLPAGIYFLNMICNDEKVTQKLIKKD